MAEHKRILRDISASHRLLKMLYGEIEKKFNFNNHHPMYFFTIKKSPGISQEEVAKRTGSDKATTARAVKKLEYAGIITREKDEMDGRAYKLYPTEIANSLEDAYMSKTIEIENILFKGMSEEEIDTLKILLNKVGDNAREIIYDRKCSHSQNNKG